jgi:hypothetical protein
MPAPTPQTLLEAIANSAPAGTSPGAKTAPMPDAPPGANFASIQAGFPANTMQSEVAGGLPPFGQDMNGYLFLISSHTLYVECGQLYQFNSALATAIGGYLAGSILGMADGTGIWLCTTNNNTSNPDTGGAGWIALAAYGKTNLTGLTGGTITPQSKYGIIVLNGTLVSPLTVILPQTIQEWLIVNNTTGAFTTTVLTAAGGSVGVQIPQGSFGAPTGVYSIGDGNIYPTASPLGFTISVAPVNNTVVQRSNAGYVLATYFNMSAGVDNFTPTSVITTVGDGFLRQNSLTNFEGNLLLQAMGGQVTNGQVPYSVVQQWASTFFNNAALTGVPTAPTPASGDSSTKIATTAFVAGTASLLGNGYYKASNGFIIQWGFANPPGVLITFGSTSGTIAMTISAITATAIAGGAAQAWIDSATLTANSFKVNTTGGNAFWIAIGR